MKFNKNNKLFLKILSGLVGVVLWFAITYTEDPIISQNIGDVPIVFEGEKKLMDNGLIIVNKDKIPDISAVIRGKRSNVISAMGMVEATCNVSAIESAGENKVTIQYNYPSSTITMAKAKTVEIAVETQKLITRNIPIKITVKNADKNEEFIVSSDCAAEKLRIKGAETDVYTASYARVDVDVYDMSENNTQEYFYTLCDKDGNAVSESNIIYKSSETITVENTVYEKISLPVRIKLSPELEKTHSLTVKSISIDKIDVGTIGEKAPDELTAEIKSISENGEYKLKITAPDGVYIPESTRDITATCETTLLIEDEVEVKIDIIGNQDKKIGITPEKIKIKLTRPETLDINGKIKASVDVKNSEEGEEIPVVIEAPEKVKINGEYTAEIYIK